MDNFTTDRLQGRGPGIARPVAMALFLFCLVVPAACLLILALQP